MIFENIHIVNVFPDEATASRQHTHSFWYMLHYVCFATLVHITSDWTPFITFFQSFNASFITLIHSCRKCTCAHMMKSQAQTTIRAYQTYMKQTGSLPPAPVQTPLNSLWLFPSKFLIYRDNPRRQLPYKLGRTYLWIPLQTA